MNRTYFPQTRPRTLRLLGSVRTIGFTPEPDLGYDPLARILDGSKRHTLRGCARIVGQVAQVRIGSSRIPLWLRWTNRERVAFGDCFNDDFARADGFREGDVTVFDVPPRPPTSVLQAAMAETFCRFKGECPLPDKQMWLCHFEVELTLMDALDGEWNLEALLEEEGALL